MSGNDRVQKTPGGHLEDYEPSQSSAKGDGWKGPKGEEYKRPALWYLIFTNVFGTLFVNAGWWSCVGLLNVGFFKLYGLSAYTLWVLLIFGPLLNGARVFLAYFVLHSCGIGMDFETLVVAGPLRLMDPLGFFIQFFGSAVGNCIGYAIAYFGLHQNNQDFHLISITSANSDVLMCAAFGVLLQPILFYAYTHRYLWVSGVKISIGEKSHQHDTRSAIYAGSFAVAFVAWALALALGLFQINIFDFWSMVSVTIIGKIENVNWTIWFWFLAPVLYMAVVAPYAYWSGEYLDKSEGDHSAGEYPYSEMTGK